MSDHVEIDGKKYYEESYLVLANSNAIRRHEYAERLQLQINGLRQQIAELMDPIVRAKMMQPGPSIIIQSVGCEASVAGEREACAKIAENFADGCTDNTSDGHSIARAIRARGSA